MPIDPGCCDGPNELLRKILVGVNEVASSGGGSISETVNVTAINGVTASVGCGVSTTGTLRVAQATDCVVTTSNNNAAGASAVNIQDGGNSITIDATSLPLPTGASTAALQTQPGVDIGDVTVNNAAGAAAVNIQDGGNSITVDGTVTATVASIGSITTSVTPGTAATNLGKAEDAPTASGDVGVGMLLKRLDTAAAQTDTDGDYSLPVVNQFGSQRVNINRTFQVTDANDILKAEDAVAGSGDAGVFVLMVANEAQTTLAADGDYIAHATDVKGNSIVVGNIANDGVDAGMPVKIGTVGRTTLPTAVADADRVNTMGNKYGELCTIHAIREMRANQVTTITASTAETTIVTAVASFNLDLYGLIVTNTSTTAVNVAIKDATAGTTRLNIAVPANDTRGFMLPASDGIKQTTANNNWTATVSASVTSVIITALTKQTT